MTKRDDSLATVKKLRDSNEVISKEEFIHRVKEIKRCKEDIIYFAEKYFRIVSLKDGLTIIKTFPKQRDMINFMKDNKRVVCLSSRQSGKCVVKDTEIKLRNKKTGEILTMPIEEFFKIAEEKNK